MPAASYRTRWWLASWLSGSWNPTRRGASSSTDFPRTVAQAEALDLALEHRGLKLDAVLELEVDPAVLVSRIEKRAAETIAAGGTVRPDDSPDVLAKRLDVYREQTAPVSAYYAETGRLKLVDGMAPIEVVSRAIDEALGVGETVSTH